MNNCLLILATHEDTEHENRLSRYFKHLGIEYGEGTLYQIIPPLCRACPRLRVPAAPWINEERATRLPIGDYKPGCLYMACAFIVDECSVDIINEHLLEEPGH